MAHIFIGLSGYSYKPWQGPGRFYPKGLKSSEFLRYYATRYRTVELDGVWYRLPTEQTVRSWIEQTPPTFFFAPKAHRQITHMSRLKPEALPFVQLMLDRLAPLAESGRLGPILLQLPSNLRRDDARLADFLGKLPPGFRWAVEFRHDSWRVDEVGALLTRHGVAWAAADTDERPAERRDTVGFCYVRLRRSAYDETALTGWAERLKKEAQAGKECFVYFKHEDEGSPWMWADRLLAFIAE
jgi:uncharacterized protein YecE (DUF72 family)